MKKVTGKKRESGCIHPPVQVWKGGVNQVMEVMAADLTDSVAA